MLGEDELKAFWTMMVSGESFLPHGGLPKQCMCAESVMSDSREILDSAAMSFSLDLPHTRIEPGAVLPLHHLGSMPKQSPG